MRAHGAAANSWFMGWCALRVHAGPAKTPLKGWGNPVEEKLTVLSQLTALTCGHIIMHFLHPVLTHLEREEKNKLGWGEKRLGQGTSPHHEPRPH